MISRTLGACKFIFILCVSVLLCIVIHYIFYNLLLNVLSLAFHVEILCYHFININLHRVISRAISNRKINGDISTAMSLQLQQNNLFSGLSTKCMQ